MKKSTLVSMFLMMLSLLVLSACGGGSGSSIDGEALFNSGGATGIPCASCHLLSDTDMVGPGLGNIASVAGTRVEGMSAEEYIHQSIVDPSAFIVPGFNDNMNKTYGTGLSDEEVDALVDFLLSQ